MEIKKMKFCCMYRMFHMGPTAMEPCYFWPDELREAVSCVCVGGFAVLNKPCFRLGQERTHRAEESTRRLSCRLYNQVK